MASSEDLQRLTKTLTDQGKIIEAGWAAFRLLAMPGNASKVQVDETRKGFYAGAHHLFSSIMTLLEPGAEPTDADLSRMDQIKSELDEWVKTMTALAARGRS